MWSNPLQNVIETSGTDYQARIDLLLKHGADINGRGTNQGTLPMYAVGWGGQYQVALYLLKKGASHDEYQLKSNQRLIHMVMGRGERTPWTQNEDYHELIKYLVSKGESVEQARADSERSSKLAMSSVGRDQLRKEVEERLEREAFEATGLTREEFDRKKMLETRERVMRKRAEKAQKNATSR